MNTKDKIEYIVKWLKDYCVNSGLKGFCIGVSGGIDSAVVSTLCAMTGLPTHLYILPCYSNDDSMQLALEHCKWLNHNFENANYSIYDLDDIFDSFLSECGMSASDDNIKLAEANTKARLRMTTLYYFAQVHRALVVGTDNKVESLTGYFTKHGDGACDILPISDLLKSQVYEIAKYLGISQEIIDIPPTDDLFESNTKTDEEKFNATYPELEQVIEEYEGKSAIMDVYVPRKEEVRRIYLDLHKKSEHKRHLPPVCKIPE